MGGHPTICWRQKLAPPASEFIGRLEQIETEKPFAVNRKATFRILRETFKVDISITAVKRHFNQDCRCER